MNVFSKETEELLTNMLLSAINDPKSFEEAEALYTETFRTKEEFLIFDCEAVMGLDYEDFKNDMVSLVSELLFKKDPQNAEFMQQFNEAQQRATLAQKKAWERYHADSESYDYWDVKNTYNEAMECWTMDLSYMARQYRAIAEKQIESIKFCETVNYKGEGEGCLPVFMCSRMRMFKNKYDYE